MVTYGFYNSVDHDRVYDATQMSEIFDGVIRDGVYQYVGSHFTVEKATGFQVRVGTGRAWFNHTWTKNDAPLILTLPDPPTMNNYYRADAVVIDIDANVNVRENKITYVKGTEVANNSSPPYPELLNGTHRQVALAYIVRQGEELEINAANINYVVGSTPCPYVTAPVQAVDLSSHVAQWQAAWEQWFQGPNGYVQTQARAFEAEIAAAEADIEAATGDVNEDVAEFRVWIASQKSQFNGWMNTSKDDFDTWFANLQYILDGDVAGHLQNEIDTLGNRITPIEKGGTGNRYGYIRSGQRKSGSTFGEFATAEGMNVISSGKCSHAEGAGEYTYTYQDDHFVFDGNYYRYAGNLYPTFINMNPCPTIEGTSFFDYLPPTIRNIRYNATSTSDENYGSYPEKLRSVYFAIIFKDETANEVLKHEIIKVDTSSYHKATQYNDSYYDIFDPDYILVAEDKDWNNHKYGYPCWYISGSNLEDSDIIVYYTFQLNLQKYSSSDQAWLSNGPTRVRVDDNGNFDKENTILEGVNGGKISPFVDDFPTHEGMSDDYVHIKINNTNEHTYSFKIYYSYTLETEDQDIEHTITWQPAGETLVMGARSINATGDYAHAEGYLTNALGLASHAEGISGGNYIDIELNPGAHGIASHAEGHQTYANGDDSHAEGYNTYANGNHSHSGGSFTEANGDNSFVGGYHTKAFDNSQFVYGHDSHIPGSGLSNELKHIETSVFGFSPYPRYTLTSKDETINIDSLEAANAICDKNRSGLTICLQCGSTLNSIYYKTLLPNDTFATYLELIELIDGDPNDNYVDYSGRILKLYPVGTGSENCGLQEAVKLFETGSLTGIWNSQFPIVGTSITIDGSTYKYPIIHISNKLISCVSSNNVNRFIKYSLIRLL